MSTQLSGEWGYTVPLPAGFNRLQQAAFQRRVDAITGTTDSRPRIRLEWGPEALTWMPHRLGDDPPGYVFPQFFDRREDSTYLSVERWVLTQRIEWEQYGPSWEAVRYKKHDGSVWDLKGPCPSEKYVALKCHAYHDGKCCPCSTECDCDCQGRYIEPNEDLINWIREVNWASQHDPDVDPHADGRFFEAPHVQQELKSKQASAIEASQQPTELDREAVDLFLRNPVSVQVKQAELKKQLPAGFKKSKKSGLYLLN